jgi:hypothetical protein
MFPKELEYHHRINCSLHLKFEIELLEIMLNAEIIIISQNETETKSCTYLVTPCINFLFQQQFSSEIFSTKTGNSSMQTNSTDQPKYSI